MPKLRLIKLRPMAMAMIGAGLLLSLSACPVSQSNLLAVRDQDISGGTLLLSSDLPVDFSGRIDVHRVKEDGSRGEIIGSAPAEREFTGILIELDLAKATETLHIELYDKKGDSVEEHRVNVVGFGAPLSTAPTINSPTSAPVSPTPTPPPESVELEADQDYAGPIEYIDPHGDCHHFNRDPADCPAGIDIESALIGLARDNGELANFMEDALARGYGINEIEFIEPIAIFSVRINDFNAEAGNFCVIFASPQDNFTPSVAGANVVQTCTFPDALTFTTTIRTDGERDTEFGLAGPIGDSDLETTITILQPLGGIFREDSPKPFSILMNNNEGNVFDDVPVDNLLIYLEND